MSVLYENGQETYWRHLVSIYLSIYLSHSTYIYLSIYLIVLISIYDDATQQRAVAAGDHGGHLMVCDHLIYQSVIKSRKMQSHSNYFRKMLIMIIIQTDHLISARLPDLKIINNNNNNNNNNNKKEDFQNCGPCCPGWPQNESKKEDKYLDLARELKKTMEHESDNYTICDWCTLNNHWRTVPKRLVQGL